MSDIASFAEYVDLYTNSRQFLTLGTTAGLIDQTGNGRDGIATGGITIGGNVGPGDLGATVFDGVNDAITTNYNPFSNAETKTFFGWAYRGNFAAQHALFGGDGTVRPQLRLAATNPANVTYFPDNTGAATTWTNAWPDTDKWYWWMLRHDAVADTANLWIGSATAPPTDQGLKTALPAFPASPGNIEYGIASTASMPWVGRMAFVGLVRGDATPDAQTFWSWGLSTAASRGPNYGLPSASNFPSTQNLPTGETLGQP